MKKGERGDVVLILTIGTLVVLGVSSLISVILPKTNQSTNTKAEDRSQRYCNLNRSEATCKPTCTRCDGKVCNYHAELEPWCQDGGKDLGGCLDSTECGGTKVPPPNCPGKLDSTGVCNSACCDPNIGASCPKGQECTIRNGYCGESGGGWSCKPTGAKVKRACQSGQCAWVICKADDPQFCCDEGVKDDKRCMYCGLEGKNECPAPPEPLVSPPPSNSGRKGKCFEMSVEAYPKKEGNGWKFEPHVVLWSPPNGKDGDVQIAANNTWASRQWGWNKKENPKPIQLTDAAQMNFLASGSIDVPYAVKIDFCNELGNFQSLTCRYSIVNGKPKVEGDGCNCKGADCTTASVGTPPGATICANIKTVGACPTDICSWYPHAGCYTKGVKNNPLPQGVTCENLSNDECGNFTGCKIGGDGQCHSSASGLPAGAKCSDYTNGTTCPTGSCTWYTHAGCFPKDIKTNNLPADKKCKDLDVTSECGFFSACKVADGQCEDVLGKSSGTCKGAAWGACQNTKENGVNCAWHSYAECYKKGTKVDPKGNPCNNLTHNDTSSECDDTIGCAWDTARSCYSVGAKCEARNKEVCDTLSGQGCKWGEKLYRCFDPSIKISLPPSLSCNMLNIVNECDAVKDCQKSADGKSCIPVPSGRGSDTLTKAEVAFFNMYPDDVMAKIVNDPAAFAKLRSQTEKDVTADFLAESRKSGITFYMMSGYGLMNIKRWDINSVDKVISNKIGGGFSIAFSYKKEERPVQLPSSPLFQSFCMAKVPGIPLCVDFSN